MIALKMPDLVSVEDYLAGEAYPDIKHEYLGGVIHAMAGGTNDHATVAMNAGGSLVPQLRGKPCRTFGSAAKLKIELPDHIRFYYPDLQVVCRPNPGSDHFQEQPVLVIEVLSESTRRTDMGEKKDAYLAHRSRSCCSWSRTVHESSPTAAAPPGASRWRNTPAATR